MRRTLCAAVVAAGLVAAPAAEAAEDAFNSRGLRKAVTVERLLEHEQALQGIAEQFWPTRESGTPGYAASRDYVVGKLEAAGYSPVVQAACFCTECQRQTGSPFSTLVGVPRESLEVSGDTLASFTTVGEDHGGDTERHFCSACGSPVFSLAAVAPALAFLKTGSLDDASWVRPAVEVWTRSAQPWSPHFEGAARLERGP